MENITRNSLRDADGHIRTARASPVATASVVNRIHNMLLGLVVLRDNAVRWAPEDADCVMAAVVVYSRRDWLRSVRVAQNGRVGGDLQEGDGGSSGQQQRRRRGECGEEAGSASGCSSGTTRTAGADKMTDPCQNIKGHKPLFPSPEKKRRIQESKEKPIAVGEAPSSSSSPQEQEEPEEGMPLDEVELVCVADFDATPPPPSQQNGSDPASDVQIRDASAENDEDGDDETLHLQRVIYGPPPSSSSSSSSLPYHQASSSSSSSSSQGNLDGEANRLHAPLAAQPPSTEYNPRVIGMPGLGTHDWPPVEEALWTPMRSTFPSLLADFLSMISDAEELGTYKISPSSFTPTSPLPFPPPSFLFSLFPPLARSVGR